MTRYFKDATTMPDPAASIEPSEQFNDKLWRFGEALQAAGLQPTHDFSKRGATADGWGGTLWRHETAPTYSSRRPGRYVEVNSGYASLVQRVKAPGASWIEVEDGGEPKHIKGKPKWQRYLDTSPLIGQLLEGVPAVLIRNFSWQHREPYWESFAVQCAELLLLLRCEPYMYPDLNPNNLEPL